MEETNNSAGKPPIAWSVFRQDDHGNRFLVASNLTREAAEQLALVYEQRGHKQHYWAEVTKGAERSQLLS